MDAERREALRLKTKSGNSVPVRNVMITADELRALLADSEALEQIKALREKWRGDSRRCTRLQCVHEVNHVLEALGRD